MAFTCVALPTLSPALGGRALVTGHRAHRRAASGTVVPRATLVPLEIVQLAAEAGKPGTVDAPLGAIVGGAIVVTAGMLLLVQGLKPGIEAAEKMQERDRKKFNKRP